MNHRYPRRDFLKAVTVGSAASLAWNAQAAEEPDQKPASSRPRLLPGCCAYSYGSYLGKGKMMMEDFILKAAELGVAGVDVTTYW